MQIKPSAAIRQNYNEIATLCKSTGEPVYLTKNGEGDLVVMDIESFSRREKMLKLREELLAVEEDRLAGRLGVTPDELNRYLDDIIDEVEHGKVKNDLIDGIRSLHKMPERYPFLYAEFIPSNKYHKMFVERWYLILYQVKDQTVYVDYIVDCRQDYGWLMR